MKMMKRVLSMLMCFVMLVGMLPMEAFAVTTDENGTTVYEIGDSVWVRGEEAEPTEVCAPDTFWLPVYDDNDQPVTRLGLCEKAEHTHVFVCPEDCELAHEHGEDCYVREYTGCTLHTHDETCATETAYDCGKEQHENHDNCTASQKCILEEHDHAALNCPSGVRFTCEIEEHTHSAEAGCPYETSFTCTEEHEHSLDDGCAQETVCTCTKEEHTHSVDAGCAHETTYTCGKENHAHSEDCTLTTVYDCGKAIHVHDETCPTKQVYPNCVEHTEHNEDCATEQKLNCGKDEHTCITEGCAADCAIEEHTHTANCDMEGVYYKWTVVEDTSSTLETNYGLPIHFFIAEPGQAIDPEGRYVDYKDNYWGSNDDEDHVGAYSTITSQDITNNKYPEITTVDGIRNVNDEGAVTQYVAKLHNSYLNNMAGFKDFGSLTFTSPLGGGSTTYYDTEYEIKWVTICYRTGPGTDYRCNCWGHIYPHIHIDGILTKKIAPAELKLTKRIPANATSQETFNFTLTKLQHTSAGNPTQTPDTSFGNGGSITLTATIPAGETSASIISPTGTTINFGYYMLEEMDNERWQTSGIVIERSGYSADMNLDPGPVYIYIAPDGTLKYSSTYNGTYATANNIYVDNERKPLNVTYTWKGIPDGLTPLPEAAQVEPGDTYAINTSYPIGTRVRGTGDKAGKYYEFMGWQHYDPEDGELQYITYENGVMKPASIPVNSDTNIHGLWVERDLPTASGYITITKTFENKPADASFSNFYVSVLHEDHRTDISPMQEGVGTWNADRTQWSYDFGISMSGTYTIVEGKYDVAGYDVEKTVSVVAVEGIGVAGNEYVTSNIVSDGHSYTEYGQAVTVTLPYDTSVMSGAAGQAEGAFFHAATVNFTNTYTKKTVTAEPEYPDLRVRKWDGEFRNTLNLENVTYAVFTLTKDGTNATIEKNEVKGDTYIYNNLAPGTYTLKETKAPEGYIADTTEYQVNVVASGDPVETLELKCDPTGEDHVHTNACYSYVTVQDYTIEVPGADGEALPGVFNPDPQVLRLNIPNEQIKADLNISKTFKTAADAFTPEAGTILVDIYGPVVKDSEGKITDIGSPVRTGLAINAPDWKLTVEDLPYGEYFVEESMASVHGYTWTGATFNDANRIQVGDHYGTVVNVANTDSISLNITNNYDVWESADFFIMKQDLSGNNLAGAKFELFDENGTNVTSTYLDEKYSASGLTNSNGLVHFVGFTAADGESKTFTLKETVAPEGYYLTTNEYQVKVTNDNGYDIVITNKDGSPTGAWDHDDDLLTVMDTPILGQITVKKEFKGLKNDQIPEGTYVTFRVENEAGTYGQSFSVTENTDWKHTFTNLPLGKYTVTEIYATINGYTYTTSYKVNGDTASTGTVATVTLSDDSDNDMTTGIPNGANAEVDFINTYTRQEQLTVTPANFTVLKRGEDGEALSGAVFTLFTDVTCTTRLTAPTAGFTVEATTDAYGQARFTGLKLEDLAYAGYIDSAARSATYYLQETKAPTNHIADDTVWKITISEQRVQVDRLNDRNIFETVVDWIAGIFKPNADGTYTEVSGNMLAVENKRIKGKLTITKTFKDDGGQTLDEDVTQNARVEIHVHGPVKRENGQVTDIGPLVQTINLSGTNKTDTVADLEIGEYVMRETFASIHGYTWTHVSAGTGVTEVTVDGKQYAAFTVNAGTPDISIGITNTYKKWEAADFYINKVKDLNNLSDGLAGAKFKLYTDAECTEEATGSFTTEATTGIAGYAHFTGFTVEEGKTVTYYLKEVTAPDNYYLGTTVWKVTITHNNDSYDINVGLPDGATTDSNWTWNHDLDVLNVENKEILGSITISKAFEGKPDSLDTIKVQVVGPNNYSNVVELKTNADSTKNWTAKLDGLHMGTYYIAEQDASVPGYTLTTTYYEDEKLEGETNNPAAFATVELVGANEAPAVTVKIQNNYKKETALIVTPASFSVKKVDAEDPTRTLDGAVFHLYKTTGDAATPVETIATATTVNGIATFENLMMDTLAYEAYTTSGRSVTYYLAETQAPEGYIKDDTVWKVELSETFVKFDELNSDKNVFEIIVNWVAGLFKPDNNASTEPTYTKVEGTQLTVANRRIKGDLTITKTFKDNNGQLLAADAIGNARVEIHVHGPITRENGQITNIGPLVKAITLPDTDGKWEAVVEDLEIGEYVLREPFASIHGYTWDSVAYANITTEKFNNMDFAAFTVDAETPDISIGVTNTYKVWTSADFYVNKVKSLDNLTDGLEGAVFQLYSDPVCEEDDKVNSTEFTTSATTGIAGYAHFTGFTVPENQGSVTYYLKEVTAPASYKKVDTIWKVEIKAVASENTTTYEPKITLLNDDTVEAVTGEWSWNRLNDTLNVVNEEIKATLTIKKEFTDNAIPVGLTSIKATVTGPNNYSETVELQPSNEEGKNWTATLTGLALGTYTVTENADTAKVAGYDLTETTYQVGDATGNTVTFTGETETPSAEMVITNTYERKEGVVNNPDQFTILKTDENGKALSGAKFRLTNDHNPTQVRDFVTGADGKVVVDNLIGVGTLTSSANVTYTLEEIEAPTGHELSENRIWTIEVKENGGEISIVLNAQTDTWETIWDWIIDQLNPNQSYQNKTLTVVNKRAEVPVSVTKNVSGLDNAGDDDYIKNLKNAEYEFELYIDGSSTAAETIKVKAGETEAFDIRVPYGSTYEVKEVVAADAAFTSSLTNATGTVDADDLNGITVTATNTYTITAGKDLELDIIKVSTGRTATPLQGAKFELYDSNDGLMKSYTSGKDGKFKIEEIEAPGVYELIETAAPSGYYKLYSPITITASYDYKVDTTGTNGPVIVKSLVVTVAGSTSYQVSDSNDFYYGIKNTPITEVSKTSDETDLLFWGGMTTASLLCMAVMLLFFPRKKGKYQK